MKNQIRLCISALAILLVLMIPVAGVAQETTSALRISVLGPDANPLAGVDVTITDTRTSSVRTSQSNTSGIVFVRNLPVGGPYTVKASSGSYADQTVTEVDLRLGDTYSLILQLGSSTMEEVVVTAAMIQTEQIALGPASVFGLEDMQDMPHVNRDLRDIIRNDPRIYIDPSYAGGAVHCAGANPRYNSLTVDGVRMNDLFGLNSNGYPTQRQPFSYDSIEQVAVELAPFDVFYGQFTACNINAVTKSGSNEWHGSAFYDYTNDSMKGDSLEGEKIDNGSYSEKRYGATLSGPILKDKLFFFLAYEKLDGADLFDRVSANSPDSGRRQYGVTEAQLDEIAQIAYDVYGYEVGPIVKSLPVEDEKFTVKLDWDINENHRASYTYNYNDGYTWAQSDSWDGAIEFSDHYYERGAELKSHTAALFSNWTDRFSTEVRVSKLDLDNRQQSRSGVRDDGVFGEVQVETWNDHDNDGTFSRTIVFLGTDDSRQANDLNYEALNLKLAANYEMGNHLLTAGFEQDDLDVFNLFIQHTETENRFDEDCYSGNPNGCIDGFREGRPDDLYYGNAVPTNDPNDGAAEWGYKINTAYLQDEWIMLGGDLSMVLGLRYDWYSSSDKPAFNQYFYDRQGFANNNNVDGMDLIQPRIGFNWTINADVSLRGGIGLYSGGNPNVWLSNNYSNDGIRIAQLSKKYMEYDCGYGRDYSLFDVPLTGGGNPIYDVPQCLYDAIAEQEPNSGVNALDPDFELPEAWKYNLGVTWDFLDGYVMNADLLFTKANNSAMVANYSMVQTGTAPDGRPIYSGSSGSPYGDDLVLTNVTGSDAKSLQFSINLSKSYDNGFDWSLGYAWTDSEDVSPMTSSVAASNFNNLSTSDPNNPGLATSNYAIPHRISFRVGYSAYWWGDNRSNFSLVGAANEGRPYSYTFASYNPYRQPMTFGDPQENRQLLYVPTGVGDSLVSYGPDFNTDAFFDFVQQSGLDKYAGEIAPRNAFNSDWWTWFDIRVEQELPAFAEGHKFAAWLQVKNFCNLINDEWCVLRQASFPRNQPIVDVTISDDGTQYIFHEFIEAPGQGRVTDPSQWEVRIGATYRF